MAKPPESLPPEVLAAFERRQPLEAIKLLLAMRAGAAPRARLPAKSPAAHAAGNAKPPTPAQPGATESDRGLSPGEVPRASSAFWGWVVVALFAYVGYRLLRG
jgi:hypothetical protein